MRIVNSLTTLFFIVLICLPVSSDQGVVLQPGGVVNQNDYEILSWRTHTEPTDSFCFCSYGDSAALWFKPEAACSLIAIRFFTIDAVHKIYIDVWDGSQYDGHITTTDSTDSNGWLGTYDPITSTNWVSGPVLGHSPIGWAAGDSIHHLWELPFSINTVEYMHGMWYEISADYGWQGKADLGSKPFIVSIAFIPAGGWWWAAEDEGRAPYHFFKFYAGGTGPDGIHDGWFLRRHSLWVETVVKYYEPIAGPHTEITGYDIDDDMYGESSGNGDGSIDPGETVELSLRLTNSGATLFPMATAILRTASEYIRITDSTSSFENMFPGDTIEAMDDFVFTLSPEFSITPRLHFSLHITSISSETQHRFFDIPSTFGGGEEILIVEKAWETSNYQFVTDALNSLDIPYKRSNFDPSYKTILWFTGSNDELSIMPIFIQYWLDNGGHLFLSGQKIGVGIGDTPFYTDYLSCQHVNTPTGLHHLKGVPDNPIFGEQEIDLFAEGINEQSYASEIDPHDPAFRILEYDTTTAEGPGNIRSSGTAAMAIETDSYKAVYFAFGFEGIQSFVDRVNVMYGILKWFGYHETGIDTHSQESTQLPEKCHLFQNYPNPFNAQTDIRYQIIDDRSSSLASIKIFNILGQEVRTLVNEEQEPGQYNITWDGKDQKEMKVSSGVYLYRLFIGGNITQTKKMILLK